MKSNLPSGLTIEGRAWTNDHLLTLVDQKTVDSGRLSMKMAELATVRVLNPGPYQFAPGTPGGVDWSLVSQADITAFLVDVRCSWDPVLAFEANCRRCSKIIEGGREVDLRTIKREPMAPEAIEHLRTGIPVQIEAPLDPLPRNARGEIDDESWSKIRVARVSLGLIRGADLEVLTMHRNQDAKEMLAVGTCLSIRSIQAPNVKDPLTTFPAIRAFFGEQDNIFGAAIRDALEQLEGGLDTRVRYRCDDVSCRWEQETELPLGPAFYGASSETAAQKRAKRSSVFRFRVKQ